MANEQWRLFIRCRQGRETEETAVAFECPQQRLGYRHGTPFAPFALRNKVAPDAGFAIPPELPHHRGKARPGCNFGDPQIAGVHQNGEKTAALVLLRMVVGKGIGGLHHV